MKKQRDTWFQRLGKVRVKRLVFIDEFAATATMQRTHGRAAPGERVVSHVPHGHWKVLSTIAAMTVDGITAAATFDGATDIDTFVTFVREVLVPMLVPGQVVVLDNLSSHKAPEVQRLIELAGARLVALPPYSPDLNPIELAISKIKTMLRKLARRNVGDLTKGIGEALRSITPDDARHYLAHRGYTLR